jgi:hypothetical protein
MPLWGLIYPECFIFIFVVGAASILTLFASRREQFECTFLIFKRPPVTQAAFPDGLANR